VHMQAEAGLAKSTSYPVLIRIGPSIDPKQRQRRIIGYSRGF
jgi:hypothetical protein